MSGMQQMNQERDKFPSTKIFLGLKVQPECKWCQVYVQFQRKGKLEEEISYKKAGLKLNKTWK